LIIPGIVISVLTFPGVIVHEIAHRLFCRLMNIPVYEVKYFQFQNPCGYVIHEPCVSPWHSLIISVGPFIVNTLLGAIILFPVSIEMSAFGVFDGIRNGNIGLGSIPFLPVKLIVYWLGISILMHAFPSVGDASALVAGIIKNKSVNIFMKILTAPVIGLIYIGAVGSIAWLDLGYAMALAIFLPKIIALFI